MEADFCVKALNEAIAKYGKPEIMNSRSRALPTAIPCRATDQGSQFTGFEWTQALKDADVKIPPQRGAAPFFTASTTRSIRHDGALDQTSPFKLALNRIDRTVTESFSAKQPTLCQNPQTRFGMKS
jgi:transposase InsO family protein